MPSIKVKQSPVSILFQTSWTRSQSSSIQLGGVSYWLRPLLTLTHKCSMGLWSGDWGGHWRTSNSWSFNQSQILLAVLGHCRVGIWLGMAYHLIVSLSSSIEVWGWTNRGVGAFCCWFCICNHDPWLSYSPRSWWNHRRVRQFAWCDGLRATLSRIQGQRHPSDPKRLILVSSENMTRRQSSIVQCLWALANARRALKFFDDRFCFLFFRSHSALPYIWHAWH